jgi:hypothetical protein
MENCIQIIPFVLWCGGKSLPGRWGLIGIDRDRALPYPKKQRPFGAACKGKKDFTKSDNGGERNFADS